ncbi:sensor histidine kinase [Lysinimonas soli]|uniref:histidine kinase n=1 Tax=Lysinimonas soli TaxID=1074233 RepID=A0ABW0NR91_9MICO
MPAPSAPSREERRAAAYALWMQRHDSWNGWHAGAAEHARFPRWASLWVPVLLSFFVQVPVAVALARWFHLAPTEAAVSIGIALIGPLALIGARRFPGPVVAVTAVGAALDLFVNSHYGPPYLALAFGIVSAIVRNARVWAWVSIAVAWTATLSVAVAMGADRITGPRIAATTLGILIVVGIGEGIRTRRERGDEFRRILSQRRQTEVQAERVRIARELHDVLAHSLSQINVQAGVGLHLMDKQPEKAKEALASIKETSKTALDEVRTVLGVLRAEGGADPSAPLLPEPDLSRLPGLVASVATGSLTVTLDDRLVAEKVPKPVQLALYRIAQESLTNVTRHAEGATHATVMLDRDSDGYRIEIRDDGTGSSPPTASESGGRGLLGMRERAELLGGNLSAGPAEGGGFAVVATLPAHAAELRETLA